MFGLDFWHLLVSLSAASAFFTVCYIGLILYRLFLHPLAKFPGPKLAAATGWYETYYDVIIGPKKECGAFVWHLDELHEKYGPILRINPDELHVRDPHWYDVLYRGGRRNKDTLKYIAQNDCPGSVVTTESKDLHRVRRAPMQPYFSKRSIEKFETRIRRNIQDMVDVIRSEYVNTGKLVPIDGAFVALTLDVITDYCFGKSWNCILTPGFSPEWRNVAHKMFDGVPVMRQFTWLRIMFKLPDWVMAKLIPGVQLFVGMQNAVERDIIDIMKEKEADPHSIDLEKRDENLSEDDATNNETIFHAILNSSLDASEKTVRRIRDECFVLVVAGMDTTTKTMVRTLWNLTNEPKWLEQVLKEVDSVMPDKNVLPKSSDLERLPVLNAVIKETMRLDVAVIHKMPVYEPHKTLKYGGWEIPPGTTLSMCIFALHKDPTIFPEPETWEPSRWLGEQAATSQKYFAPFSRGSRACLGLNLAWAEMYLGLASILRNFELEFVDVTREKDIAVTRDLFVGMASKASKGVNARVVRERP